MEESLMLNGGSSQHPESNDLTPTKRSRTPIINLEESFDQNSITRSVCPIKVKNAEIKKWLE
ncbi:hypothetical protein Bca52824_001701 [Brassica carinata]|uniref:Uncharacterized protein n=1 Tax=Brassica carinata TaxID=52824 RepID=A0A8X7WJ68_BRACI|nr:hypothetical protein Bca52824_001701 [Brassica carinata]